MYYNIKENMSLQIEHSDLILSVLELAQQILSNSSAVVGVYQAQSVETPTLREARAGSCLLGQIALHECQCLLLMPTVNHTQ